MSYAFKTVEQRCHERINVKPSFLSSTGFTAIDLSESGMKLSCMIKQHPGKTLNLNLHFSGQSLELKAEIMWCRKAASIFQKGYQVEVAFKDHSISEQLLLRKYIEDEAKG